MKQKFPLVSIIVNVFNEEKNIVNCLRYISEQTYPKSRTEILLVDDYSTDRTVELAVPFGVKVYKSGYKNIERSKSIGLTHASGEFVLFVDADVYLVDKNWIKRGVVLLQRYQNAVAVQSIRWHYKKNDFIVNRYCNLFGVNDPFVFSLGKRGVLTAYEKEWPYKETIRERGKDYFLVGYNLHNLPTIGSQGYMARKKLLFKSTWKPYFFHLDSTYELVSKGLNVFIMTILPIQHNYVHSFRGYYEKLYRNIYLFLRQRHLRKYTYEVGSFRFFLTLFFMMTIIVPLYYALRGYVSKPDRAWFLHPIFCFTVPCIYALASLQYILFDSNEKK